MLYKVGYVLNNVKCPIISDLLGIARLCRQIELRMWKFFKGDT